MNHPGCRFRTQPRVVLTKEKVVSPGRKIHLCIILGLVLSGIFSLSAVVLESESR